MRPMSLDIGSLMPRGFHNHQAAVCSRLHPGVLFGENDKACLLIVLARGMRDALIGGDGLNYVLTLPVSLAGHLAWNLGERWAYAIWPLTRSVN